MFLNHSVLMIGSGLSDPDVLAAVNSSAVEGSRTHYLLCRRGERNTVEKRRLLDDQHVRVIEYVDLGRLSLRQLCHPGFRSSVRVVEPNRRTAPQLRSAVRSRSAHSSNLSRFCGVKLVLQP